MNFFETDPIEYSHFVITTDITGQFNIYGTSEVPLMKTDTLEAAKEWIDKFHSDLEDELPSENLVSP